MPVPLSAVVAVPSTVPTLGPVPVPVPLSGVLAVPSIVPTLGPVPVPVVMSVPVPVGADVVGAGGGVPVFHQNTTASTSSKILLS